jgi:NhaP-type Na+/H+ or K+/H+ antiporter
MSVLYNLLQIFTGFAAAFLIGFSMKLFNYIDHWKATPWLKFFTTLFMALMFPIVSELTEFHEAKFIGIIFYGYFCFRYWGVKKPEHELQKFWVFCQPFLFGTVGAAVLFDDVDSSVLGRGLLLIFCGVTMRWFATFFVTWTPSGYFTKKERMLMAFAWIPKATVQAAIGGIVL